MDTGNVIKVLEKKRQTMLADLDALERVIKSFDVNTSNNTIVLQSSIDNTDNDRQKVSNVIKEENRFLKVREMAIILNKNESNISVDGWVKKISPVLSFLKKKNSIVKFMEGNSNLNTFWGSPKWLDEKGNIKKEHMYDKSQIHEKENYII